MIILALQGSNSSRKHTIMTIHIAATNEYANMSHTELVNLVTVLAWDAAFQCYKREEGERRNPIVNAGKAVIFIDIADMHGLNHKYNMALVDEFIRNVVADIRTTDIVYRHGGDELVCIIDSDNVEGFLNRLDAKMSDNNLYGVYGVVFCDSNTTIENAVKRGDQAVMAIKSALDVSGKKAKRDDVYVKRDSVRVYTRIS